MTDRALRSWRGLAPDGRPPGPVPRSHAERRRELWLVARAWRRLGVRTGERAVHHELGGAVSLRTVREHLSALKARRRRVTRRLAEQRRVHVEVKAIDVLWAQDATHLGRVDRTRSVTQCNSHPNTGLPQPNVVSNGAGSTAIWGEVIKEVASTRLLDVSVGAPASGDDVIATLEALRKERGLPLVYVSDNGSPYRCALVKDYLARHKVVHLKNLPRTPQHNAWSERSNRELKQETGLGRGVRVLDVEDARARVEKARCKIDQCAPRASRGWRTPAQLDETLPRWHARVSRDDFWREACSAIQGAMMNANNERARRMREREAIFATLELFELIHRTRGGRPLPSVKPEGNC